MPAETAAELHRMLALLEGSAQAHRPDVRALIERSQRLLAAMPAPRPPPSRGRALGKLLVLGRCGLDAATAGLLAWKLLGAPADAIGGTAATLAVALAMAWLVGRVAARLGVWHEAWMILRYHLAWGADWFAEAASAAAARRMEARETARVLMRGWRAQARRLPDEARLVHVGAWLGETYGPHAAEAFAANTRRALAATPHRAGIGTMAGAAEDAAEIPHGRSPAARLRRLRWVPLMEQFALLAASGALWAAPQPMPAAQPLAPSDAAATPTPEPEEPPERELRRTELRELIRQKRAEIQRAEGWNMKTAAENANREAYQQDLRGQIAGHERELEALGLSRRRR